jgi:putative nucleotidyltransferase with HDIG domain
MNSVILSEILNRLQDLPTLSPIVNELLSSMNQENIDVDYIAKKISCDQTLTVKTLRLANSSFYGMQHKVSSIQEAIAILGFRNVRTLITSSSIASSFSKKNLKYFNYHSFWRHSIATAVCAKELARHSKTNQEFAFITGLIHDLGQLVLVSRYPELYEKTMEYQLQQHCDQLAAERATLGTDHCVIGKTLIRHWNFPEEMQIAVAHHHPEDAEIQNNLSAIVHMASIFSLALDLSRDEQVVIPKIANQAWTLLKLDERTCADIFAKTEQQFEEICEILIV